jgi:hypothetical protein
LPISRLPLLSFLLLLLCLLLLLLCLLLLLLCLLLLLLWLLPWPQGLAFGRRQKLLHGRSTTQRWPAAVPQALQIG